MQFRILPLAATALLSSTVNACVEFSAYIWTENNNILSASLYDNGQEICWLNGGGPDSGNLYRFTCIGANYAAILGTDGVVQYANPGGNYRFQCNGQWTDDSYTTWLWWANEYGC
jgi:hypothetical protein